MRYNEMKDVETVESVRRYLEHRTTILEAFNNARTGRLKEAEDPVRLSKFAERERMHRRAEARTGARAILTPATGQERLLGVGNDILSIEFLEAGLIASSAVGMLTVQGMDHGTGFLIGNGLVMTNHHVIAAPDQAEGSELELDREDNRIGPAKGSETFDLEPGRFFLTDKALDFTIVAVAEHSRLGRCIADFGFHPIIAQEGKIRIGDPVNIIQHPNGGMKSVVVHDSRFLYLENGGELDPYCWYSSDTQPGSSGSPVFNNRWEVVALHHRAIPKTNDKGELVDHQGRLVPRGRAEAEPSGTVWVANEGIRASRLAHAIAELPLSPDQEEERGKLLDLWAKAKVRVPGQGLEQTTAAQPLPEATSAEAATASERTGPAAEASALGLPIMITIRIGRE